jgi:hypothetical protein
MSTFSRAYEAYIQKDSKGKHIYYPQGRFDKGYIIENDTQKNDIIELQQRLVSLLFLSTIFFPLLLLTIPYTWYKTKKSVKGMQPTNRPFSKKEQRKSIQQVLQNAPNGFTALVLLGGILATYVFVKLIIYFTLDMTTWQNVLGFIFSVIFAFFSLLYVFLGINILRAKFSRKK